MSATRSGKDKKRVDHPFVSEYGRRMLRGTVPSRLGFRPLESFEVRPLTDANLAVLADFLKEWLDLILFPGESPCPSDDPSWQSLEIPDDKDDGLYKLLNFRLDELAATNIARELCKPFAMKADKPIRFPIERMDVFRIILVKLIRGKVLDVEMLDAQDLDVEALNTEVLEAENETTIALQVYRIALDEFFNKLEKTLLNELWALRKRHYVCFEDISNLFVSQHPQTGVSYQKIIKDAARQIIRGLPVVRAPQLPDQSSSKGDVASGSQAKPRAKRRRKSSLLKTLLKKLSRGTCNPTPT